MPTRHTRRRKHSRKTRRRIRRSALRKQRGGGLEDSLVAELNTMINKEQMLAFLAGMNAEGMARIHPNFPRKNNDKYVIVIKDLELEDDALQQKLVVLRMTKDGEEFKNVSAQFGDDLKPQTYLDEYQDDVAGDSQESSAISRALGAVLGAEYRF